MIDFETYLMLKLILAVVGTVIVFPLAMWWLSVRDRQRNDRRKKQQKHGGKNENSD